MTPDLRLARVRRGVAAMGQDCKNTNWISQQGYKGHKKMFTKKWNRWWYIYAVNSPFLRIPKMLYCVEVWGLCRLLKYTTLAVMFQAMFFHSSIVQFW
jgi:hypothetical protein